MDDISHLNLSHWGLRELERTNFQSLCLHHHIWLCYSLILVTSSAYKQEHVSSKQTITKATASSWERWYCSMMFPRKKTFVLETWPAKLPPLVWDLRQTLTLQEFYNHCFQAHAIQSKHILREGRPLTGALTERRKTAKSHSKAQ